MINIRSQYYLTKLLRFGSVIIILVLLLMPSACGSPTPEMKETTVVEPEDLKTTVDSELPLETTTGIFRANSENLFIWRISSPESSAFLMGSVHLGNDAIYPLDPSIEQAYEIAENLVVEVDISNVDPITTTQLLMQYGTYPEGESLKVNLSEDMYTWLSEIFEDSGIGILMLDNFRPWVISTLVEEMQIEEMGYSTEYGIDMYFIKKAKEDAKNIIELESAEYQLALLSSLSDELMIALIEDILDNPLTQQDMDRLFNAWENGDTRLLESVVFDDIAEIPMFEPYYEKLYTERNYEMAAKIEGFMTDEQVYFIVVGAAHLVGEEGLLSILGERGYNITQLLRQGH